MAVPISYNIRNLVVRKTTTIMAALGIALTVAVLLSMLSLVNGLKTALQATGNPLNVLVLRKGSTAELTSGVSRTIFQDIKFKPGIARDKAGQPIASLEMITVLNLPSVDAPNGINVNLRGITQLGINMRDLKLVAGRWFTPGRREVVVGESIAKRFPAAHLGDKLHFGRGDWDIVGVMSGGQSAINSEVFGDLNQVSSDFNRTEFLSSALLRATDEVSRGRAGKEHLRRPEAELRCDVGDRILPEADDFGFAHSVPGNIRRDHYGDRQQFRRHEHHVRRHCAAVEGDWNAAGARIFAGKYLGELLCRIGAAGRARRHHRLSAGAAAEWVHNGHRKLHHL